MVLLLWILFNICVSYLSFSYCLVCSLQPCGHLLRKCCPLVCDVFLCFVTFPYCVLGQVWQLMILISDLFFLTFTNFRSGARNISNKKWEIYYMYFKIKTNPLYIRWKSAIALDKFKSKKRVSVSKELALLNWFSGIYLTYHLFKIKIIKINQVI